MNSETLIGPFFFDTDGHVVVYDRLVALNTISTKKHTGMFGLRHELVTTYEVTYVPRNGTEQLTVQVSKLVRDLLRLDQRQGRITIG